MKNKEPLSPHIQIYRWHISSLVSISHRITGIINIIAITLIASLVFLLGPVIFSLVIAGIIVLPMYLAVQFFGDKD